MDNSFTTIDFETAQGPRWSICQVGIVKVVNFKISDTYSYLVQPPGNVYSKWNTLIHGITPEMTINSPTFDKIWNEIKHFLHNQLVVAHNADFDLDVLHQTLKYYSLEFPNLRYDCTYKIFGYKLNEICQAFDIDLIHHDALSDALACAKIYLQHLNKHEPDFSKINQESNNNIFEIAGHKQLRGDILKPDFENADRNNPFYKKKVVLTGVLNKLRREEAAEILKTKGADIDTSVTKKTNFVITGHTPGPSKIKKIEKLNNEGYEIKIIKEEDFLNMMNE